MVRVGEEIEKHLEALGYTVIHDTTNHEPLLPLNLLQPFGGDDERIPEEISEIEMFIDPHRDVPREMTIPKILSR